MLGSSKNIPFSFSVRYKYVPLVEAEDYGFFTLKEDDEPQARSVRVHEPKISYSKPSSNRTSFRETEVPSPDSLQKARANQFKQTLHQKLQEAEKILMEPISKEWSQEINKPALNCFVKVDNNNHVWVRGEAIIDAEPNYAMSKLKDPKVQMQIDGNIEKMFLNEEIEEGLEIVYNKTRKNYFFDSRDFVILVNIIKGTDGSCTSIMTSIRDEKIPPSEAAVRANMLCGYTKLTPIRKNGKVQSRMELLTRCAFNGDISRMMAGFVAKSMATTLANVKKYFESSTR